MYFFFALLTDSLQLDNLQFQTHLQATAEDFLVLASLPVIHFLYAYVFTETKDWKPSELWKYTSGEKIKPKDYAGDWVITHNVLAEKFSELKEFVKA
jgi:hypothetical protein